MKKYVTSILRNIKKQMTYHFRASGCSFAGGLWVAVTATRVTRHRRARVKHKSAASTATRLHTYYLRHTRWSLFTLSLN